MSKEIKTIIKPGAINELNDIVRELFNELPKVTLFCDHNTFKVAGKAVGDIYQGEIHTSILGKEGSMLLPEEPGIGEALLKTPDSTELFIACGSGVVNDITRFVAWKTGKPFISVATACSMDGYASTICPLVENSLKFSYPARPAKAIIADTDVLVKAPQDMAASGFGDIVGKLIAKTDWLLSHTINGEAIHQEALSMVEEALAKSVSLVQEAGKKSPQRPAKLNTPEIAEALMAGLVTSGLSITVAGNSRPAASAEHLISHYLGMKSLFGQAPHHLHGKKVALGALLMARLYHRVFTLSYSEFQEIIKQGEKISDTDYQQTWTAYLQKGYGPLFQEKITQWEIHQPDDERRKKIKNILKDKWEHFSKMVFEIIPPVDEIEDIYSIAGLPLKGEDMGYSKELIHETMLCSKDFSYSNKYSLLQLLDDLKIREIFLE